ncbi:MAG: PTS sugar transporter subunit IIA [Alkalibacterium sp.]|uniref:BglG family transcription antiterminator n=1 Tax=Alkalibacterium sp. TaxID=1872447 RepID=UPI0039709E3E
MLTFREIDIIRELLKNPVRTIDSLSKQFNISKRTVRYDMDNIGDVLYENGLLSSSFNLFDQVDKSNKEKIKEFIENLKIDELILQPNERYLILKCSYILLGKLNLTQLSRELQVSRVTIKNDYNQFLKELKQLKLASKSKHKEGFILTGKEKDIRDAQWRVLNSISKETMHNKLLFSKLLDLYMGDLNLKGINQFLSAMQEKLNCVFSDKTYKDIRNYLIVVMQRNKKGEVTKSFYESDTPVHSYELEVLKSEKGILEEFYGVRVKEKDLIEIAEMVMNGKYIKLTDISYNYWIEMDSLVFKLIRIFSEYYGVDLTKDKELFEGLSNHLKPILFNIKNNIESNQPISYDVKSEYPDVYECTLKSLKESDLLPTKRKIDEEVSLITIHFAAALHRGVLLEKKPKNILLVCSQGIGVSKLLEQRLEREFNVKVVDTIPLHYLSDYPQKHLVDMIITAVDLEEVMTNLPIIKVNTILTEEDLLNLEKAGIMKTTKKIELSQLVNTIYSNVEVGNNKELVKALKDNFGSFILDDLISADNEKEARVPKSHIQIVESVDSWKEAIVIATRPLVDNSYVAESYIEKVTESFEKYGYYMFIGDGLAIPHARSDKDVFKTGFSILILKNKVQYSEDISIKLLICFASRDNLEHLDTLVNLMEVVKSDEFKQALNQNITEEVVFQLISSNF